MPLLKLASSILLALLLASLSALASPPAAPGYPSHDQALVVRAERSAAVERERRLVAMAETRHAHGFATPAERRMATIPLAGETVPESGQ